MLYIKYRYKVKDYKWKEADLILASFYFIGEIRHFLLVDNLEDRYKVKKVRYIKLRKERNESKYRLKKDSEKKEVGEKKWRKK